MKRQYEQRVLALLYLFAVSARVFAAEQIDYPEVAADPSFADVLALKYTEPDQKLVYGTEQPDLQYGLLWLHEGWLPEGSDSNNSAKAPLIVFIHGGCWLNSFDVSHTFAFSAALAQAGYAVWSLEYRRTGDSGGGWPGTYEDILAGINYREQLQQYPVDTANFVIMGHSAGGHLALLAGTAIAEAKAVIGLAPIADLVQYARGEGSCQAAAVSFMGKDPDSDPELYTRADPAQQQLHNTTYVLEGTVDSIVPLSANPPQGARQIIAADAGHFDWVHPGTPANGQLRQLLAELFVK